MSGRLRRSVLPVILGLALVAVLFVGVFPTRTYLSQREALAANRSTLEELEAENEVLAERVEALRSPDEIERLARQDFGMVRPGEEPYRILPSPEPPVVVPGSWPFSALARRFG